MLEQENDNFKIRLHIHLLSGRIRKHDILLRELNAQLLVHEKQQVSLPH